MGFYEKYDVVIVGGALAGLTSAAYLSRAGKKVIVCEKEAKTGGLVGSFSTNGFVYDSGIRAFENSGIILPMLRDLGIELDLVTSPVSIGLGNNLIRYKKKESLAQYELLLKRQFPENKGDIPATSDFPRIKDSVETPIPQVYQAGQWTFSPSGLPISILTGKLAADVVEEKLKKK